MHYLKLASLLQLYLFEDKSFDEVRYIERGFGFGFNVISNCLSTFKSTFESLIGYLNIKYKDETGLLNWFETSKPTNLLDSWINEFNSVAESHQLSIQVI